MAGKKGKKKSRSAVTGQTPRRGKRRSIRYEAEEQWPQDKPPQRADDAPPGILLRKLTVEEALFRLRTQLLAYADKGQREVLVVHGKGLNSLQGRSVLGPEVRDWCDKNPSLVLSWRQAPAKWGGEGAIVVVLN
jgi:dsDNA-specific endonuclease/ATPase MutS2